MLTILSIRLRYWHLMVFFMWLSFKFQLSAVPTGRVILALKDLDKSKIHSRQATEAEAEQLYCLFNLVTGR